MKYRFKLKRGMLTLGIIMGLGISALALDKTMYEFFAPSVPDADNTSIDQIGSLVFDAADGKFRGLNASGAWVTFSETTGGTDTFFRSATIDCDSSSSYDHPWGETWISAVGNRDGNGQCSITVSSARFGDTPICQVSAKNRDGTPLPMICYTLFSSATSGQVTCLGHAGAAGDFDAVIFCHGPQN